jgi:hypothetical protein
VSLAVLDPLARNCAKEKDMVLHCFALILTVCPRHIFAFLMIVLSAALAGSGFYYGFPDGFV